MQESTAGSPVLIVWITRPPLEKAKAQRCHPRTQGARFISCKSVNITRSNYQGIYPSVQYLPEISILLRSKPRWPWQETQSLLLVLRSLDSR